MTPDVWSLVRSVGAYAGAFLTLVLGVYLFPGSPLRKIVEEWIRGRVSSQFDKELETHRHRLSLDAEQVRADHQRRLHDASLYSVKKHEVYRELFNKLLIADGAVGLLVGSPIVQSYDAYTADDIRFAMERLQFTGSQKEVVLREWDRDRKSALKVFNTGLRNIERSNAHEAVREANNYFLVNALYINDSNSNAVAEIMKVLNANLGHAMFPSEDSRAEQRKLNDQSSELIERLKRALREELDSGGTPKR